MDRNKKLTIGHEDDNSARNKTQSSDPSMTKVVHVGSVSVNHETESASCSAAAVLVTPIERSDRPWGITAV